MSDDVKSTFQGADIIALFMAGQQAMNAITTDLANHLERNGFARLNTSEILFMSLFVKQRTYAQNDIKSALSPSSENKNLSYVFTRLKQKGYIGFDKADARIKNVSATKKGLKVSACIAQRLEQINGAFKVIDLSDIELNTTLGALHKIAGLQKMII